VGPGCECELSYARTCDVDAGTLVSARACLLTAEELERERSFAFDQSRREYLVTRALAQFTLARWTGVRPGEVAFVRTGHGKPHLQPPSNVRFNLTNTTHLVACLVGVDREVGVDAEPLARADDILGMADTLFRGSEHDQLNRLPLQDKRRRAVELWTFKEAYVKARGLGVAISLGDFHVEYASGAPVLQLTSLGDDDGKRWELRRFEIEGHIVAACVERIDGSSCTIQIRRTRLADLLAPARHL
jgi:4'-phosphopantetheinyl transferase